MSRSVIVWPGAAVALLLSVIAVGCGSSDPGPARGCSVDSDCGTGWCQESQCQSAYMLTMVASGTARTDGKYHVNGRLSFSVQVSGGSPPSVEYQVDGARMALVGPPYSWEWAPAPTLDGEHVVRAVVRAGSRVYASSETGVVVDHVAPAVPTVNPVPTPTRSLTIAGTAEPNATLKVYEGGVVVRTADVPAAGTFGLVMTGLADGTHALSVTATDWAGNESAPARFPATTLDTLAPAAPVIDVLPSVVGTQAVTVTGRAEAGSTVMLLDQGIAAGVPVRTSGTGTWSVPLTLADGAHVLTATATDDAGNASPPSVAVTFTISRAPVTITGPARTNQHTITVGGTAPAGESVEVLEGASVLGATTALSNGTWTRDVLLPREGACDLVARTASVTSTVLRVVTDWTRPTVTARVPAPRSTNVWSRDAITLTLSEPVLQPIPDGAITLAAQGGTSIAKTVTASPDGRTLTITPAAPPAVPGTLQVTIAQSLTDQAGNPVVIPSDAWSWELPSWQGVGGTAAVSTNHTYPDADSPAIGIDPAGRTHVAFVEYSSGVANPVIDGPIIVKQFDGSAWAEFPVPNDFSRRLPGNAGMYCRYGDSPSMAFDSTGQLTMAWSEYWGCNSSSPSGRTWWYNRMSTWTGSGWQDHPSMPFHAGGGATLSPVVRFDGQGRPVVAWRQNFQDPSTQAWNKQVFAAAWSGTAWVEYGGALNASPTADVVWRPSLALDTGGVPHVAWIEMAASPNVGQLRVKRWDSALGQWIQVGNVINLDPARHVSFQSLVLDGDMPVVAWAESTSTGCGSATDCPYHDVHVARWTGSTWQQLGAALNTTTPTPRNAVGPVLSRASTGRYLVAWAEVTSPRTVIVASWNGREWSNVGSTVRDATAITISAFLDVVADSLGIPTAAWAEHVPPVGVYVRRFNQ